MPLRNLLLVVAAALATALVETAGARGAPAAASPPPGAPALQTTRPAATDTSATHRFWLQAGRARVYLENGERVSILQGGVHLTSDSVTIDSDWARAYRDREHAFFYENVVVHDGDLVMTGDEGEFSRRDDVAALAGKVHIRDRRGTILADRARYWRAQRVLRLWGHVDFQDSTTRVRADSAVYRQDTGIGDAFGNVVITDVDTGSEARGPHAVYDRNAGRARLVSRPRMVVREKGAHDIEVEAEDLQTDRNRKVVRAGGNVRIIRDSTTATADSAVLYRDRDLVELRGRPLVQEGTTRMRGREIDIHIESNELRRIDVRRDASLVQTRADTSLVPDPNEVHGDDATLHFENGALRRAVVVGSASSKYVPRESRPNRVSLNEAQADSIVMLFDKDEIEEVIFTGTATGVYRYFEGDLEALRHPVSAHFDTVFGVMRGDTTAFDFRRRAEVVQYSAERILYLAPQNDLLLDSAAEVTYQGRTLRAGHIRYDADTDLLDATDRPVLDDSGDRMYGDDMGYDLNTKHAWVRDASTTFDQGFYNGRELRKEQEGVFQVRHGTYTTCDLAHPHYRFESDQMKIYLHNKVVGRPVRLYLGNVPIGWFPFLVNSVNTDRHSGFLQPYFEFGVVNDNRYIRGLDYYWAASQYFDVLFSGDFTDRHRPDRSSVGAFLASAEQDTRSIGLSINTRYKLRYNFDGYVNYHSQRDFGTGLYSWTLGGSHDQKLGERATLRGSLDYASSDRAVKRVNDFRDYEASLNRQLTSALTLNRPGDLVSASVNLRRLQKVGTGDTFTGPVVTSTLPGLSVTFRSIRFGPAPRDPEHPGFRGFLHDLQLTPGFQFQRQTIEKRARRDTTEIPPGGVATADSFRTSTQEIVTASTGAGLSHRFDVLFLDVTPSVNYSESYIRDTDRPNDKRSTRRVGTGLAAATTLYGTFHPRLWGLTAVRHRIDPRVGIAYVPEIAGQQHRSTSMSLSLSNTIDAKVGAGDKERRVDGLFAWSLSTTYNPTLLGGLGEPDRKFGNIGSQITLNRSGPLRLTIDQTYDPYRGRITETRIPFVFGLSGHFGYGEIGQKESERNRVVQEEGEGPGAPGDSTLVPGRPSQPLDPLAEVKPVVVGGAGTLGWQLGLAYSLVRSIDRPTSSRVGVSFGIQPTHNWSVRYSASYDAATRTFGNPQFHVTRDLHCWKASFSRVRDINDWRYYFRIWVTRHEQDLFVESGDRSVNLGY